MRPVAPERRGFTMPKRGEADDPVRIPGFVLTIPGLTFLLIWIDEEREKSASAVESGVVINPLY